VGRVGDAGDEAELVFLGLLEGEALFGAVPEAGDLDPAYARSETWAALGRLVEEGPGALRRRAQPARLACPPPLLRPLRRSHDAGERRLAARLRRVRARSTSRARSRDDHARRARRAPPARRNARFRRAATRRSPGSSSRARRSRRRWRAKVLEEAGVRVRDVRYVASQPWPFPSQLMIGCHARAEGDALAIDRTELEDARWFAREEIAEAMDKGEASTGFKAPTSRAIAHYSAKVVAGERMMPKVSVDIWSDVMCPWCAVGYTQFAKAVGKRQGRDRRRRPLDAVRAQPRPSAEGKLQDSTWPKSTAARPRTSPRCARRCRRPPRAPASRWTYAGEGEPPAAMMWNTFEAHKLLRWALAEQGPEAQTRLKLALLRAHFQQRRNVGDREVLLEIAEAEGFDRAERPKPSPTKPSPSPSGAEEARGRQAGINSVPSFVVDGKYLIQGAREPEDYAGMLRKVAGLVQNA
jgi:predicted DsbA family dithiol-disulfide isomerase